MAPPVGGIREFIPNSWPTVPLVAKCYRSIRSIGFAVLAWLGFAQASRLRRGAGQARNGVSKRMRPVTRSSASSSLVSRAKSSVPSPALRSVAATNQLRGLCRLPAAVREKHNPKCTLGPTERACERHFADLKTNLLVVFLHRHRESLPCLQDCSRAGGTGSRK